MESIEFICINDGSTDSTEKIIQSYIALDSRFKLLNKKNSGYGDSLNKGLKVAKGEFIGIVESDDYVDSGMFSLLYSKAIENNLDLIRCGYFEHRSGIDKKYNSGIQPNRVFAPTEIQGPFFASQAIWSHLYRKDFLLRNNISFLSTPGASYQDTSFVFKALAMANRYMYIDSYFYHYRMDNEASSINNPKKVFCVCDEWKEIFNFFQNNEARLSKLAGILLILKSNTYNWNYERIAPDRKKEFLNRWSKEIRQGLFYKDYSLWPTSKKALLKLFVLGYCPSLLMKYKRLKK